MIFIFIHCGYDYCYYWMFENSIAGIFMVDTGILFSNIKFPSHECKMTFWTLTNSDFPTDQTFHQIHDFDTDFDLHRTMSGFHGALAKGLAWQQGTLIVSDTWFRSPIFGFACATIVDTRFLELTMSLLDFSHRIPRITFSILLNNGYVLTMIYRSRNRNIHIRHTVHLYFQYWLCKWSFFFAFCIENWVRSLPFSLHWFSIHA